MNYTKNNKPTKKRSFHLRGQDITEDDMKAIIENLTGGNHRDIETLKIVVLLLGVRFETIASIICTQTN